MNALYFHRRYKLALLASLLTLGLVGCSEEVQETSDAPKVWPVKVATVKTLGETAERHFAGRVQAVQSVDLAFQVGGQINQLPVVEGQIIRKGTLIAALDDKDYKRTVREAEVNVDLLKKTLDRQSTLVKKQSISTQQVDETESRYRLAQVTLENARQNIEYTRLTAPFDALVTRRLMDNFSTVQAGHGIVRLQDVSETRIEVFAPEQLLATISKDRVEAIEGRFEFIPGKVYTLEYRHHESEANPVTQTYRVELGMPRLQDYQLLPGMNAEVTLRLKVAEAMLGVPLNAIQTNAQGEHYVWQIDEESQVRAMPVQMGASDGQMVQIVGLSPNARVVAAGGQALHEGALVRDYQR